MLRLLPQADVKVVGRCSGHGGSWGVLKQHFETAIKVGRPAARQAAQAGKAYVASECPLAGQHLLQGIDRLQKENKSQVERSFHPIELLRSEEHKSEIQ